MTVLDGKVALVTGAGQGSGMGIALEMAAEGAAVAVVGRTESKLHDVVAKIEADGGRAIAVRCDVGSSDDIAATVARVVAELGTVDILVNVAQSDVRGGKLLEITEDEVDLLWRTGPLATLRFMRLCHPHLRGGGAIVNFGSGAQMAPQGYGVYAGVKEAIQAMTRAASVEWGPDGIRANVIAPLVVSPSMEATMSDPGHREASLARVPVGRFAEPSDVGKVAVFLASEASAMVTGQLFVVDGGMMYHR